jgi:hypothetical protein
MDRPTGKEIETQEFQKTPREISPAKVLVFGIGFLMVMGVLMRMCS